MILKVKIGNVYRGDPYVPNDLYFECDEEYEEVIKDNTPLEDVEKKLLQEFNNIYDIYETNKGFTALVY